MAVLSKYHALSPTGGKMQHIESDFWYWNLRVQPLTYLQYLDTETWEYNPWPIFSTLRFNMEPFFAKKSLGVQHALCLVLFGTMGRSLQKLMTFIILDGFQFWLLHFLNEYYCYQYARFHIFNAYTSFWWTWLLPVVSFAVQRLLFCLVLLDCTVLWF